jgi:hypothetical protein
MFSILAGHPGLGKSLWTILLIAEVTRRGDAVVICSAEDSLEHTLKPRLQAAGAVVELVHALVPVDDAGAPRGVSFPTDAPILQETILSVGAVLAVIDPVTAMLDSGVDSHRDASLRSALAPLHRIAEETTAATLGVYHLNKSGGSDPMMRLGGSIGGPGQARSCLLLDRDPDDPGKDSGDRRVLGHFKCNVGKKQPSRLLEVQTVHLEATNLEPAVGTARIVDIGESPHSAKALLAANGSDRSALDSAIEFLKDELDRTRYGAVVTAKEIIRDGRECGHSERTLRRAADMLGVKKTKHGFDKQSEWRWSLPKASAEDGQPSEDVLTSDLATFDDSVAIFGSNGADSLEGGQISDTATLGPSTRSPTLAAQSEAER